nr:hypothetical protein [Phytoactinopolyspora mesophila]
MFTWHDGGFRPVAATGDLGKPRSWLADQALRLCRYYPPAHLGAGVHAPISYGWWTDGSTRWVFRRGHLGNDPTGRPGNFFAHILAGHRDALPLTAVAGRFGSSHWWDGGPIPKLWDRVELADIPPATLEPVSGEQLESFLTTVLRGRGTTCAVLREPPAVTIACVAVISRRLPGLLDGLQFSTYEAPQHAVGFDLVGMHSSDPPPRGAVAEEAIDADDVELGARMLLSDQPEDQDLARILLAAATVDGTESAVDRMAAFLPSFRRHSDDDAIDTITALVLRFPDTAETLLKYPFGVRSVIRLLVAGDQSAWSALVWLPPGTQVAVGTELALKQDGYSLAEMLRQVRSGPPAFQHAFHAALLTSCSPVRLGRLRLSDRLELLRAAAQMRVSQQVVDALYGRDAGDLTRIADCRDLPTSWRGHALARRLMTRADPAPALERLCHDFRLAIATAQALDKPMPLIRALEEQPHQTVMQVVLTTVEGFNEDARISLISAVLEKVNPLSRPHELAAALRRAPPQSMGWDVVATTAVLDAIGEALERHRPAEAISSQIRALLTTVGGPCSSALHRVIDHLSGAVGQKEQVASENQLRCAMEAIADIKDREQRKLLANLTLGLLPETAAGVEYSEQICTWIRLVSGAGEDQFAETLLRLAADGGVGHGRSSLLYVASVIRMVGDGRIELTRSVVNRRRRLRNPIWQRLAVSAARGMNSRDLARATVLARRAGDETSRWWTALID